MRKALIERFRDKTIPAEDSDCLLWVGGKDGKGYGAIKVNGKQQIASRLAWEIVNGRIPEEVCVLHKCDNPACVNVEHLFLGTQADNVKDMVSKGHQRGASGETNGNSKLTADDILNIKQDSGTLSEIARKYGVSFQHISSIKRGGSWKHVPNKWCSENTLPEDII